MKQDVARGCLDFLLVPVGGVGQEGGRRKKQEGVSGIKKQLEESQ